MLRPDEHDPLAEVALLPVERTADLEERPGPRPVPLRLDGEPREELALSLEERPQRGDEERLAEPPRTRKEELLANGHVDKRPQDTRLVNVGEPLPAQVLERVNVCRNLPHANVIAKFEWKRFRPPTLAT